MAADYGMTRNYIEWLAILPWQKSSGVEVDIPKAKEILDSDHYDLEKVKDRILDYLSVRRLKPGMSTSRFVGPPGAGKTSLGKSIARALGRKFVRLSLGGVHDEAEIRGHRRTYIGALPGQDHAGYPRAETNDPVFMLDEIDKVGRDFRGDPASALLEASFEQNFSFRDNYLDAPFDLSKVLFITTANMLDLSPDPCATAWRSSNCRVHREKKKGTHRISLPDPAAEEENGSTRRQAGGISDETIRFIIRRYTRSRRAQPGAEIGNICPRSRGACRG